MGELAARAAKAGVQVIAETHSDHFLDGVRIEARWKRLDRDATRIHFFTREGTENIVVSPKIMDDGKLSEWPKGFFDQKTQNLKGLLGPMD